MSANSFGSKCGTALGTAICGWILQLSGYNGAVQAQSSSALTGITIVYVVLPVVLNIFSAIILSFINLKKNIHLSFRNYVIESKKFKEIIMGNKAFYPGQTWLDTEGKRIQAHGGSVIYVDGIYYWYGENKEKTDGKNGIWHWGVKCYKSTDLYNWEDCGIIIPPEPDDINSSLHPTKCVDRPHIIYNKKTKKYVSLAKGHEHL